MKLTVPDELKNNFDMLMKSLPLSLQQNDEVRDTTLVYLKLGGMTLARNYLETTKKYLENDPLQTGQNLKFPKIVEPKSDDEDEGEDENEDEDEDEDLSDEDDLLNDEA
jgi:hypothetical protein